MDRRLPLETGAGLAPRILQILVGVAACLPTAIAAQPTCPTPQRPPTIDLNGRWMDGPREIHITHTGKKIRAEFVVDRECAGAPSTRFDFEAELQGNRFEGKTNSCKHNSNVPAENGFFLEEMKLAVSDDGEKLEGCWFPSQRNRWEAFTINRKCTLQGETELRTASQQGPQQLITACQRVVEGGARAECLQPYCAVADCFGPGAHFLENVQATGPGAVGFPLVLAQLKVTGPHALPTVSIVSPVLYRNPTLISKDTSGVLLTLVKDAKRQMEGTAVYHSDLGNQQQVIDCLEGVTRSLGWPTSWPR